MHYDIRDVLWAPGRALTGKKIVVMTSFLLVAWVVYDLFAYLALAVDGNSLDFVWNVRGLFPLIWLPMQSIAGQVLYAVGMALALLSVMGGFLAVGVIDIEEIRGYPFLSIGAAIRFAVKRLRQIFMAQLTLGLFLVFVILLFLLLGLASRIPFVGEWLFAITLVFPGFLIALLTILVVLVACLSVLLMPAVAAADRTALAFDAIIECFSTLMRQPVRWLGYTAYAVVAAKLAGFVFAYFCFRAVQLLVWAAGLGGGDDRLTAIIKSGLSHLPSDSDLVQGTFNVLPGLDWSFSISPWTWSGVSSGPVSYVVAAMLLLIFVSIWGYMLAVLASAQARGYAVIKYRKDGYRIAEENSLFYRDEPVNPPLDEVQESKPEPT